ncbi:hypothetical protein M0812_11180 [Anaeramoeba flamelloides]|uniref:Uncharacterized protein n=1 Tax=Anaeramoeba flamelloides TaxID=1746091 RepID=A0AAV7ZY95_9EUKA|nr:hypothetical protein M0812_11180 [Anaeramoeba flamelloides]|eukprot:Anaeramoba_flamelloidesa97554_12.p1 GENE.a97554_12~~a97554_12.p1  ORF type:complete len:100 (-),score=27.45 a97554_12:61-360(-)
MDQEISNNLETKMNFHTDSKHNDKQNLSEHKEMDSLKNENLLEIKTIEISRGQTNKEDQGIKRGLKLSWVLQQIFIKQRPKRKWEEEKKIIKNKKKKIQ